MRSELSVGLDFTRVIACFMVVILHVSAASEGPLANALLFPNIYNSLVRSCVPIFLMLSGALLLIKRESVANFYKKRFVRIFPPLFFWSGFYVCWNTFMGNGYANIYESLLAVIKGPVYFHLWYLYMLVGVYLFMPFLSKIYQTSTRCEKKIYLSLWFVVSSVIPFFSYFYPSLGNISIVYELSSFSSLGGYVFLGAYVFENLCDYSKSSKLRIDFVMYFLSCLLTIIATYLLSKHDGTLNQFFYSYLSPIVVLSSVFGFRLLITIGSRMSKYSRMLSVLSGCTLGIYCIHAFVMNRLSLIYSSVPDGHSLFWVIPILSALIFLLSLTPVYFLRTFKSFRIII